MGYLKLLGLTATTTLALTALVGLDSASAVTFCEENVATGCKVHVNAGATIDLSAEDSIKLSGPFGIVFSTCTESTNQLKTTNTGADDLGTAVVAHSESLTFSGCTRPTTVGNGGTWSVTASGTTGNASVTSTGTTVTIHELPNIVGNPSTCAYTTNNTALGTLTASATATTFDISATITSETANCPSGTWSGHYTNTGTRVLAFSH